MNTLYQKDIISIKDLSLSDINCILQTAKQLKEKAPAQLNQYLKNKIVAHCFFEPSTRTRLSFETAVLRLGGQVIGFADDKNLSIKKGETLHDTIKVIASYADLIILRHAKEGAARLAAEVSDKPVINAGDGANQHPTQALIDLFTIQSCQTSMDNLAIALVGDLKHSRSIHSFTQLCLLFDVRLFLVAPDTLGLPDYICDELKNKGVRFSCHQSLAEVMPKIDIVYLNRIQQERYQGFEGFERQSLDKRFVLTMDMLKQAKSNLKILDPLPRVNTMEMSIDQTPYAHYFQQAANGVFVREALLTLLLNEGGLHE